MDRIWAEIEPYLAKLAPYWAEVESTVASTWLELEGQFPQLRGIDRDWFLIGAAGAILLVLWLLVRKRGGGGGGRKATPRALEALYNKFAKAGVPEWKLPFKLFTGRANWAALPEHFLMELAARLMDKETVIKFIVFAERHGLEQKRLPKLATYDVESAMKAISAALTGLVKGKGGKEADTALSLAMRIDPTNPQAMYTLAADHYGAQRFKEAMPLLERTVPLCKQLLDEPERPDVRALQRGASSDWEQAGTSRGDMEDMFAKAMEMYEDCLERVNPNLV